MSDLGSAGGGLSVPMYRRRVRIRTTVLGLWAWPIFIGIVVNNPVAVVLPRRCVPLVFLRHLASFDTGVDSSMILVYRCGLQPAIGISWIDDTCTALEAISIVVIIVALVDVSHV